MLTLARYRCVCNHWSDRMPTPTDPTPPPPAVEDGAATPLDAFLTYRLHALHKLSDAASDALYQAECGLPVGEARCLAAVGAFAPLSVQDLARRANLNKAQASRAAQSLADQGLVSKAASASDARGVVLDLTGRGRLVHQRVMALIARRNHEIFGVLSDAEQRQLAEWLDRLVAHAQAAAARG